MHSTLFSRVSHGYCYRLPRRNLIWTLPLSLSCISLRIWLGRKDEREKSWARLCFFFTETKYATAERCCSKEDSCSFFLLSLFCGCTFFILGNKKYGCWCRTPHLLLLDRPNSSKTSGGHCGDSRMNYKCLPSSLISFDFKMGRIVHPVSTFSPFLYYVRWLLIYKFSTEFWIFFFVIKDYKH